MKSKRIPAATSGKTPDHGRKDLFAKRLATILLVQSKLLPPSALGVKDLNDNI